LAISKDGKVFKKYSEGPISDRSIDEPYFCVVTSIKKDDNFWKIWYVSCSGWKIINKRPEPFYRIKYTESYDGINWNKSGIICIDYDNFTEAIGKPFVYEENNIYKMIYSFRSATDYRVDKNKSYRLGYAESINGINWIRKDSSIGIKRSENGWDSEMMEYGTTYKYNGKRFLLYNGNGFGKSGFGYAVLENE